MEIVVALCVNVMQSWVNRPFDQTGIGMAVSILMSIIMLVLAWAIPNRMEHLVGAIALLVAVNLSVLLLSQRRPRRLLHRGRQRRQSQ